jgi:hypothetical protein
MKGFKLNLFLFISWWSSIVIASYDNNTIYSALEPQTNTHQDIIIKKNNLHAFENVINMTSDITVNYNQDFFHKEDLKKICHAQINQFTWKCPTIKDEKVLKFRTIDNRINSSTLIWYLKSINEIDIVEIDYSRGLAHQIEFHVEIDEQTISLSRLYPTYPKISGFEILQFITNLAFQCKFFLHVSDLSDISRIYFALYGTTYYKYHFKGIDLSQKFAFKKIIVKKQMFLDCFEKNIRDIVDSLSQLFYQNIQACENAFVSVEFCPLTFETHHIFYKKSLKVCIDWSSIIGGYQDITLPFTSIFEITSEDIVRIMNKKQQQSNLTFIKTNMKKIIKTYDEIKIQIFDISFLMTIFSKIFELCFFELEKRKSNPNPEDIFKFYLRPCVLPNINLSLKYHTHI